MKMEEKLLMIWAIVLITCFLVAFGYWLGEKALPEKDLTISDYAKTESEIKEDYESYLGETSIQYGYNNSDWGTIEIGEQILYQFTTTGEWKESFKPEWFLKIIGTDLSRCFIDGRLRVDLNGEIYWIRLER